MFCSGRLALLGVGVALFLSGCPEPPKPKNSAKVASAFAYIPIDPLPTSASLLDVCPQGFCHCAVYGSPAGRGGADCDRYR